MGHASRAEASSSCRLREPGDPLREQAPGHAQPVVDLDQGCKGPRWEAAPSGHASWSQRSCSRLLTAVIVEQRDEWHVFQSRIGVLTPSLPTRREVTS
jgi:hypothetical protein